MKIQATTADAYRLFHEGSLALARAEREGIRVDVDYCLRKKDHLQRKIDRLQRKIGDTPLYKRWRLIYKDKTNIYSNHQLGQLLYKNMNIEPPKYTNKGKGSTDEDTLSKLGVPGLAYILEIRKLSKIKNTYLEAYVREQWGGFIHPSFNLHTVRTFRSSSEGPNFQNVPKRDKEAMKITRRAIIPRPGHLLIEADFSSLEVNISECYHHDPNMMNYLLNPHSDMHLDMAKQIFVFDEMDKKDPAHAILRQGSKNGFVFPQFYGDYYGNNAYSLVEWAKLTPGKWKDGEGLELSDGTHISTHLRQKGIKNFDQFVKHMKKVEDDFWNRRFKEYGRWREKSITAYRKRGWLKLHTGFTCSGLMRRNEIVNYPIQGSAFHCLLFTFIEMDRFIYKENLKTRLIGQIHDSMLLDVYPPELDKIKDQLQYIVTEKLPKTWNWIIVPLSIEVDEYGIDLPWVS